MKYEYEKLRTKYGCFELPAIRVTVEGKSLEDNNAGFIIGDASVELTSGFEASEGSFRIFGCTDAEDGQYLTDKLKPYILLGSYTIIEMGYAGALEEVFRGYTARVEFVSEEDEIPCVEVTVMDIKGAMMAGNFVKQLRAASYGEAVKEILRKQAYQSIGSKGLLEKIAVMDTPDKQPDNKDKTAKAEMAAESDYEFVVKAAKKFNFEFFSELGTVFFRKAKDNENVLLKLGLKQGIMSHRIAYDVRGIVREFEARNTDDGKGTLISAKVKCKNRLSLGNKVDSVLDSTAKVYVDSSIHTKEEAQARAKSMMEKVSWGFGSLECECVGLPVLRPGYFIEVDGLGKGADNQFYLTEVRHVLSGERGYYSCLTGQAASVMS